MEENYIRRMQRYENQYSELMRRAQELFALNGETHTKEECCCLQEASMCQMEMANISVGEERLYHQRCMRELNRRIEEIIKIINPEVYRERERKKREEAEKRAEAAKGAPTEKNNVAARAEEPGPDTEKWFQEPPRHSFADVAGMDGLKKQLQECIADSKMTKLNRFLKLKNLHSYFFIGPPGCGKTYLIEAFAHELMDKNYKYLSLKGSDILSKYVGEAEKIVTRLFEVAEENTPCIIFIDEIDGVCRNRSLPNLPEYASSITTAFLTGYNRINSSDKQIIFIGATNYPNRVDNAMLDRVELVRVPLPDKATRQFSLEHHLKPILHLEEGFDWAEMAELIEGYNQRDIGRLVDHLKQNVKRKLISEYGSEAQMLEAMESGRFAVTREMFMETKNACLPSPKEDILKELDEWEKQFNAGRME